MDDATGRQGTIYLESWAGRSSVRVAVLHETPKRYRVRLLGDGLMPNRGYCKAGLETLVPKDVVALDEDTQND